MRLPLAPIAFLLAPLLSGCVGGDAAAGTRDAPASGTFVVEMTDYQYSQRDLWVTKGTIVSFRNAGDVVHSAEAIDGSWSTQDVKAGAAKSVTLSEVGDAPFQCKYHKKIHDMNGVIHVVA